MGADDSNLDAAAVAAARRLLEPPRRPERLWPPLVAAAALTLASLGFAFAMIAAPPLVKEHTAVRAPG